MQRSSLLNIYFVINSSFGDMCLVKKKAKKCRRRNYSMVREVELNTRKVADDRTGIDADKDGRYSLTSREKIRSR